MDKRNFIQTIGCLFLGSLLLGACEGSGLPDVPQPEEEVLQLQSVDMTGDSAASTRAAVTSVETISVYATKTTHAEYGSNPLSKYTLSGGSWSSDNAPLIASEIVNGSVVYDGNAYLYACYPVVSSVSNRTDGNHTVAASVNVASDSKDFKATGQDDYLYAAPVTGSNSTVTVASVDYTQVTPSKRTVSFSMRHALAKVSFKVKKSTAATEKLLLKSVEILSATNRLQTGVGTMNLRTGVLNGLASVSSLTLTDATGVTLTTTLTNPNVTCLIAPMTASESILSFRLTVRVDGETADRTFETKVVNAVQWTAGNHYVYTITVDKMKAGLNGIQIDDWKSDANQNTNIGI